MQLCFRFAPIHECFWEFFNRDGRLKILLWKSWVLYRSLRPELRLFQITSASFLSKTSQVSKKTYFVEWSDKPETRIWLSWHSQVAYRDRSSTLMLFNSYLKQALQLQTYFYGYQLDHIRSCLLLTKDRLCSHWLSFLYINLVHCRFCYFILWCIS